MNDNEATEMSPAWVHATLLSKLGKRMKNLDKISEACFVSYSKNTSFCGC